MALEHNFRNTLRELYRFQDWLGSVNCDEACFDSLEQHDTAQSVDETIAEAIALIERLVHLCCTYEWCVVMKEDAPKLASERSHFHIESDHGDLHAMMRYCYVCGNPLKDNSDRVRQNDKSGKPDDFVVVTCRSCKHAWKVHDKMGYGALLSKMGLDSDIVEDISNAMSNLQHELASLSEGQFNLFFKLELGKHLYEFCERNGQRKVTNKNGEPWLEPKEVK